MSQTNGVKPDNGGEIRPLIIYNSVQDREQNAVDCATDASLEAAAQIYNAAIVAGFPKFRQQMDRYHPLNFGGAGIGNSIGALPSKLDVLAAMARAEAEAHGVLARNFERLAKERFADATATGTEAELLLASLRELNAMIGNPITRSPWLG